MDNRFYRAFEDRHRGSRALIAGRLEVYLPFLAPLKALYPDAGVLDVGCGRGEWLELLTNEGFIATGVDLDEGMLEACRALNLTVRNADALAVLREQADDSLLAVSGFHIAEHVPFPVLEEMVAEAVRALKPGGLLILETPNAENVVVGTNNFYVDPTHERPIPSLLLSFLTDFKGFARSKVMRLQESTELHDTERPLGVMDVLAGASPDYSVVAQKDALAEVLAATESAFAQEHGLSLDQLASRYDQALSGRLNALEERLNADVEHLLHALKHEQAERVKLVEQRLNMALEQAAELRGEVQQAESRAEQLQATLDQSTGRASRLQDELNQSAQDIQALQGDIERQRAQTNVVMAERDQSLSNAHHWYIRATELEQQLNTVLGSSAWRITGPGRGLMHALRHPTQMKAVVTHQLRRAAPHARLWLARRPVLERKVLARVQRYPWLSAKLRSLLKTEIPEAAVAPANDLSHGLIDQAPLTPRGRMIEKALHNAMTKGPK